MVVILMIFANAAYLKRKPNEQKLLRQEYGEFNVRFESLRKRNYFVFSFSKSYM